MHARREKEEGRTHVPPPEKGRADGVNETGAGGSSERRRKRHGKTDERAREPPQKRGRAEDAAERSSGAAKDLNGKRKRDRIVTEFNFDPQTSGGTSSTHGSESLQVGDTLPAAGEHRAPDSPGGTTEAPRGSGQTVGRPVRAGTRRINYSETKRRGPRGPRKERSAAYMDKSSDTGGRIAPRRAIAVSDVTIERIVGGAYEWRDGAYAKRRRVVSDDGG